LLLKSKSPRAKDDEDARVVIPSLGERERGFLAEALPIDHPWRHLLAD
jgi:hypothetical protein